MLESHDPPGKISFQKSLPSSQTTCFAQTVTLEGKRLKRSTGMADGEGNGRCRVSSLLSWVSRRCVGIAVIGRCGHGGGLSPGCPAAGPVMDDFFHGQLGH